MAKISKKTVDATSASKVGRTYLWDDRLAGFGVVVHSSGIKSYLYQYRTAEGRTRKITIGRHGDALTAEQARTKAEAHAHAVKSGEDPMQDKRERRNALTVADVLDHYLASARFAQKAASTQAIDRGRIERHLKPLMGRKTADKLTTDDVRRALADIRDGKTAADVKTGPRGRARVRGGEGTARMAIAVFKVAMGWAVESGLLKHNAAAIVRVGPSRQRTEVIESTAQYAHLFETIQRLEDQLAIRRPAADAIRVIALTGARRGEIAGLRWRHVDLKKGVVTLSRGEHKTGAKTGDARLIGLPAAAQAVIARQPAGNPDDYVFTPSRGEGAISLAKPWRVIRKAAGLSDDLGLHGLRHSLATQMALDGSQAAQIMAVLGHRNITTAQRYVHLSQDARSQLAETAACGISAALTGAMPAEVKSIKRSRKLS